MRRSAGYGSSDGVDNRYCDDAVTFADWMVDITGTINLMFSVILLLIAIYLSDPLDLSVFPSLLLITTLYRLSLTISTSRLVLLQHNAGNIVDAFGKFVVGGNHR